MPSKKQRAKMKAQKYNASYEKDQMKALHKLQEKHPEFNDDEKQSMEFLIHTSNKFIRTFPEYTCKIDTLDDKVKEKLKSTAGLQTPVVINIVNDSNELQYSWILEISLTSPVAGAMLPVNDKARKLGIPQWK